jgi:hypothetical protein
MKALMEASREESAALRKPELKEFPKPDSRPELDTFGWRRTKRTDRSLAEVAVMKTPTILQWYQILRQHYQFTVFQSVPYALWLAH